MATLRASRSTPSLPPDTILRQHFSSSLSTLEQPGKKKVLIHLCVCVCVFMADEVEEEERAQDSSDESSLLSSLLFTLLSFFFVFRLAVLTHTHAHIHTHTHTPATCRRRRLRSLLSEVNSWETPSKKKAKKKLTVKDVRRK